MAAYEDLDCSAKESSKRDRTNAFKGVPLDSIARRQLLIEYFVSTPPSANNKEGGKEVEV